MKIPKNCLTCEHLYKTLSGVLRCQEEKKGWHMDFPLNKSNAIGCTECNDYKQAEKLCAKCEHRKLKSNGRCMRNGMPENYKGLEACWAKKCDDFKAKTPAENKRINCDTCSHYCLLDPYDFCSRCHNYSVWAPKHPCFECKKCGEKCEFFHPERFNYEYPCRAIELRGCKIKICEGVSFVKIDRPQNENCTNCKYAKPIAYLNEEVETWRCLYDRHTIHYVLRNDMALKHRCSHYEKKTDGHKCIDCKHLTGRKDARECVRKGYRVNMDDVWAQTTVNCKFFEEKPSRKKDWVKKHGTNGSWGGTKLFEVERKVQKDIGKSFIGVGYYHELKEMIPTPMNCKSKKEEKKMSEIKDIKTEIKELEKKVEEAEKEAEQVLIKFKNYAFVKDIEYKYKIKKDFIKYLKEYKKLPKKELRLLKRVYCPWYSESQKRLIQQEVKKLKILEEAVKLIEKYKNDYEKFRLKRRLCQLRKDCYKKLRPNVCKACGAEFPKDAKFCPQCGKVV